MTDWPSELRKHAVNLDAAVAALKAFCGTDEDEHVEALEDAAKQLREDASEYEKFNA